jgi:tRNA(Ile)-lysidine synthase
MDNSDSLVSRTLSALRELGVSELSHMLVGISGGVDSVSLSDVLVRLFRENAFEGLALMHINHQLRSEESERDAEFVRSLAAKWEVPLEVVRSETFSRHEVKKESIELAARNDRYSAFAEFALRNAYTHVLTAHNADDQVETVLMNIFRGTGLRGLGGIPPKRRLAEGVDLVRPWLGVRRPEIEEYARSAQLNFQQDSSNDSRDFFRNRVRHDVLPFLEEQLPERDLRTAILQMSAVLRSDWEALQSSIRSAFARIERTAPSSLLQRKAVALDLPMLIATDSSLWHGLFECALDKLLGKRVSLSSKSAGRLAKFLNSESQVLQLGGLVLLREEAGLLLVVQQLTQTPLVETPLQIQDGFSVDTQIGSVRIELLGQPEIVKSLDRAYFDLEQINERGLVLRSWVAGERMHPFGMAGTKLVSDLLNEHGIKGAADKRLVPVIADATSGEILWIPGVRASESYKVTSATERTLLLVRIPSLA